MRGDQEQSPPHGVDWSDGSAQAVVSMIVCMIILLIFFIFFCLLPVYRLLEKRWNHWNQVSTTTSFTMTARLSCMQVENDPRWAGDQFQFSARPPSSKAECRGVPLPPSYSQIFHCNDGDTLGSPPPYKSVESGINIYT